MVPTLRASRTECRTSPRWDLPRLEVVGRTADNTIDRLLGRSRAPVWPWIATGVGLIAVIGAVAVYLWTRRPLIDSVESTAIDNAATLGDDDLDDPIGRDHPVDVRAG